MARAACQAGSAHMRCRRASASSNSALYRQRAASKCAGRCLACPPVTARGNSSRKVGVLALFMRLLLSVFEQVYQPGCILSIAPPLGMQKRPRGIGAHPCQLAHYCSGDGGGEKTNEMNHLLVNLLSLSF